MARTSPTLQTEGQGSDDFGCGPDVVERHAKDRSDTLLQIDRADIRAGQAESQGSQIARPGSLAFEQRRILRRKADTTGAAMAFDDVEDDVGVKALEADERYAVG